jgi:hypothetical protein
MKSLERIVFKKDPEKFIEMVIARFVIFGFLRKIKNHILKLTTLMPQKAIIQKTYCWSVEIVIISLNMPN